MRTAAGLDPPLAPLMIIQVTVPKFDPSINVTTGQVSSPKFDRNSEACLSEEQIY